MTDTTAKPRRLHPMVGMILALIGTAIEATLLALALGGVAALMAHRRALALIAIWALSAAVLALLRPVRTSEAATTEREPRLLLPLLFLIPLIAAPLAAWCERTGIWQLPGGPPMRWLGVAIAALGLGLRIVAMAQLGSRFSPLVALQKEHALETRGLYARVRHPGYLGSILAALGGSLSFGGGLALPLVAVMAALLWARTGREEALLERRFGDDFRRYRARSGRFLPRLY